MVLIFGGKVLVSELIIIHRGVFKTAPATPGLLNTVNQQLSLSLALLSATVKSKRLLHF